MQEQNQSSLTAGQQRRLDRKNQIIQMKKTAKRNKIIGICVGVVIGASIIGLAANSIYKSASRVKESSDYSAYLTDNGTIENVKASEIVTLPQYENLTIPANVVEFSDEALDTEIRNTVLQYAELDETAGLVINDNDKVNIDYVGKLDGVEFEGGNSNGAGSDLTIGSGTFIDDFEEQLIGKAVGEEVLVEVTFPEDYSNAELSGKDATFDVVINGIYSAELTDEIVATNLSEFASTADEYRAYVRETRIDEQLNTYIDDLLTTNTTVSTYPSKYLKHLQSLKKYESLSQYQYMQQLYASMGYPGPSNFEEYIGKTEAEFDKELAPAAEETLKNILIYQAIYEVENLDIPTEYFDETESESIITTYGKGSVMQQVLKTRVLDFIKESAIIL